MNSEIDENFKKIVADGLNTQGFLFQDKIYHEMKSGYERQEHRTRWVFEAAEYPVTAENNRQTKIDFVLTHVEERGIHLVLECKRSHPDYRSWVFFGRNPAVRSEPSSLLCFETCRKQHPFTNNRWTHQLDRVVASTSDEIFSYYLEIDKTGKRNKAGTDTIETALSQVTFGQSGLVRHLLRQDLECNLLRVVPCIVTTADLFGVEFEVDAVDLETGRISVGDFALKPLDWSIVNYHVSDDLRIKSGQVTAHKDSTSGPLGNDVKTFHQRSVFVVTSTSLSKFLLHLNGLVID